MLNYKAYTDMVLSKGEATDAGIMPNPLKATNTRYNLRTHNSKVFSLTIPGVGEIDEQT